MIRRSYIVSTSLLHDAILMGRLLSGLVMIRFRLSSVLRQVYQPQCDPTRLLTLKDIRVDTSSTRMRLHPTRLYL